MIEIKTRLHDGIYRSQGGGKTTTHYRFKTGPRNLMRAADMLEEHREEMTRSYGNIGHLGSWIEIDSMRIRDDTIMELDPDYPTRMSRTEVAKGIIRAVRSGTLKLQYAAYDKIMETEHNRHMEELGNAIAREHGFA